MRKIREITAEEEQFRLETYGGIGLIRRNPVIPEPVGTLILVPMWIVGYDPDCDGSLMARLYPAELEFLDDGPDQEILDAPRDEVRSYGVHTNVGLYPNSGLVVTPEELRRLFETEGA